MPKIILVASRLKPGLKLDLERAGFKLVMLSHSTCDIAIIPDICREQTINGIVIEVPPLPMLCARLLPIIDLINFLPPILMITYFAYLPNRMGGDEAKLCELLKTVSAIKNIDFTIFSHMTLRQRADIYNELFLTPCV